MEIQFSGFTHSGAFREFAFDCVSEDRSKTRISVIADLELSRKYRIAVQELPLLCRRLVEDVADSAEPCTLTFSEAEMLVLSKKRSAQAEQIVHKKAQRRPKPPASNWQLPLRHV